MYALNISNNCHDLVTIPARENASGLNSIIKENTVYENNAFEESDDQRINNSGIAADLANSPLPASVKQEAAENNVSTTVKKVLDDLKNKIERPTSNPLYKRSVSQQKIIKNKRLKTLLSCNKTCNRVFNYVVAIGLPLMMIYYYTKISNALAVYNTLHPYEKQDSLHLYEKQARELFGPGILEHDRFDLRPKLLYLQSSKDSNNAFVITKTVGQGIRERNGLDKDFEKLRAGLKAIDHWDTEIGIASSIRQLNQAHDVKYKVLHLAYDTCKEIQSASQKGELKSLILAAHGKTDAMEYLFGSFYLRDSQLYSGTRRITEKCFIGLAPDAEIILLSCSTGKDENGIASVLAKLSQRPVWAPIAVASSWGIKFTTSSPPVPLFTPVEEKDLGKGDLSCKFFPDGTRKCGYWQTKSWSNMAEHASEAATHVATIFRKSIIDYWKKHY